MTATPQIIVVTDANVLINLMHVARLDLCARLLGYQRVSSHHLHRNATEFDFRYNHGEKLGIDDTARATIILNGIGGKRMMYWDSDS